TLYDQKTGQRIVALASSDELIQAFAFSADGSRLAIALENGNVELWDLRVVREQLAVIALDWDHPPYRQQVQRDARLAGEVFGPKQDIDGVLRRELEKYSLKLLGDPFNAETYYQRALAQSNLNDYQAAIHDMNIALALRLDSPHVRMTRARFLAA